MKYIFYFLYIYSTDVPSLIKMFAAGHHGVRPARKPVLIIIINKYINK